MTTPIKLPKLSKLPKHPFISICTPTFNRRPFFPYIIKCFQNQTYPKDKIEWIIIDDGTDKIEDMVAHIPQVKYFKYDEKMFLGKKRNLAHDKAKGDIIISMDDDDYYPPERISHAVDMLRTNPNAFCAGSSEMYIFFKHINQMYRFGPYGPNHCTAATFAFRKELLTITRFEDTAAVAEERHFLKEYTIPFVQLNPMKTILVFSHTQNSFDKKHLLENPNQYMGVSDKKVEEFVKEEDIKGFFMEDIDKLLEMYEPGRPENKPDVLKQLDEIKLKREEMMKEHQQKMFEYNDTMNKVNQYYNQQLGQNILGNYEGKINQMSVILQEVNVENTLLKEKVKYLEDKIRQIITEQIIERKKQINQN
jgi:glycosyltransferase involved in cell wall biosynthesis